VIKVYELKLAINIQNTNIILTYAAGIKQSATIPGNRP